MFRSRSYTIIIQNLNHSDPDEDTWSWSAHSGPHWANVSCPTPGWQEIRRVADIPEGLQLDSLLRMQAVTGWMSHMTGSANPSLFVIAPDSTVRRNLEHKTQNELLNGNLHLLSHQDRAILALGNRQWTKTLIRMNMLTSFQQGLTTDLHRKHPRDSLFGPHDDVQTVSGIQGGHKWKVFDLKNPGSDPTQKILSPSLMAAMAPDWKIISQDSDLPYALQGDDFLSAKNLQLNLSYLRGSISPAIFVRTDTGYDGRQICVIPVVLQNTALYRAPTSVSNEHGPPSQSVGAWQDWGATFPDDRWEDVSFDRLPIEHAVCTPSGFRSFIIYSWPEDLRCPGNFHWTIPGWTEIRGWMDLPFSMDGGPVAMDIGPWMGSLAHLEHSYSPGIYVHARSKHIRRILEIIVMKAYIRNGMLVEWRQHPWSDVLRHWSPPERLGLEFLISANPRKKPRASLMHQFQSGTTRLWAPWADQRSSADTAKSWNQQSAHSEGTLPALPADITCSAQQASSDLPLTEERMILYKDEQETIRLAGVSAKHQAKRVTKNKQKSVTQEEQAHISEWRFINALNLEAARVVNRNDLNASGSDATQAGANNQLQERWTKTRMELQAKSASATSSSPPPQEEPLCSNYCGTTVQLLRSPKCKNGIDMEYNEAFGHWCRPCTQVPPPQHEPLPSMASTASSAKADKDRADNDRIQAILDRTL
jgi:hypothetical protein